MRTRNMADTATATTNCPAVGVAHRALPATRFARSAQRNSATWQAADGSASFRATRTKDLRFRRRICIFADRRLSRRLDVLERRLQARVESARPCRAERTRVRERRAAIGEIGHGAGIEKGAIGRVAMVEDIIHPPVNLERLVDLIRGVEIEHSIGRQPLRLVGFVADEILTADEQRVRTNLEGVRHRVIETGLDSVAGNRRNSIARQDLNVAVAVCKRTVGANLQSVEESCVHQGVARIKLQCLRREVDLSLETLAARRTDVLEITKPLQRRGRNREDVVGIFGTESTNLPPERTDAELFRATQAG